MDSIPKRLAGLRELAGLSARALGLLAGLHPTHIGLIERGDRTDPSSSAMAAIANVLGCSMDWLVAGRGQAPSSDEIAAAVARARDSIHRPVGRDHTASDFTVARATDPVIIREGFDQRTGTEG